MMRVCLRLRAAAALLALLAISGPAGAQDGVETSVAPPRVTPPTGGSPNGGTILVTKRPVQVLAGPSLSAAVLYGFPAGRPFRLIGRDAGFAQIQDLKSSATGWIDEAALAQPSPEQIAPSAATLQEPETVPPQQAGIQKPDRENRQGPLSGFLGGLFGRSR